MGKNLASPRLYFVIAIHPHPLSPMWNLLSGLWSRNNHNSPLSPDAYFALTVIDEGEGGVSWLWARVRASNPYNYF